MQANASHAQIFANLGTPLYKMLEVNGRHNQRLGYCAASVGDVNGDGGSEFLIAWSRGDNPGVPNSWSDGNFIIVKSDTSLALHVTVPSPVIGNLTTRLYPNPARNILMLEYTLRSEREESADVDIQDIMGNVCLPGASILLTPGTHLVTIPFEGAAAGAYFLQLRTRMSIVNAKFHLFR